MATPTTDLLEIILRECAAARPQPWYPSDYARATGVARDALDEPLDRLRLGGLIRLTDWTQGKGQGYALTPAGEQVLERPRLLDRLRAGVVPKAPVPPGRLQEGHAPGVERAKAVRDALLNPSRPVVTLSLLAVNVLVFLVGAALAQQQGAAGAYLSTPFMQGQRDQADMKADAIRHEIGLLQREDLVSSDQWWRLLTCCFVHIGFIHLLMNMYALYVLGQLLERLWGPGCFLLLYLIAGVVGSSVSMVFAPAYGLAGASGAICGLLGAMAAWVYLNRSYLPRELSASLMRAVITNVILIVFISLVPGVSASAHFGGGVGGLVAAVPLTWTRFGHGLQRGIGLLGALVVPVAAVLWVAHAFAAEGELPRAQARYRPLVLRAIQIGQTTFKQHVLPICRKAGQQEHLSADEVQAALVEADQARQQLEEIAAKLPEPSSYEDSRIKTALQAARDYVEAWSAVFDQFHKAFTDRKSWGPKQAGAVLERVPRTQHLVVQLSESVLWPPGGALKGRP